MKNLMLIGKYNKYTQELNTYLADYFRMQLCSCSLDLVCGMLDNKEPDLILINLMGIEEDKGELFTTLAFQYGYIPVICVGTLHEQETLRPFLEEGCCRTLTRPISNANLARQIAACLGETISPKEDEYSSAGLGDGQSLMPKKKILLVDDNAVQLRAMRANLQDYYDVSMATSATEAIILIEKDMPDLIFLDYEMPINDGRKTLEMIRDRKQWRDIPVVFLTAVNDKAHIAAVLKMNPAGYLLKPADRNRVMQTIHKILGDE